MMQAWPPEDCAEPTAQRKPKLCVRIKNLAQLLLDQTYLVFALQPLQALERGVVLSKQV